MEHFVIKLRYKSTVYLILYIQGDATLMHKVDQTGLEQMGPTILRPLKCLVIVRI